jgi:hypothetical protein
MPDAPKANNRGGIPGGLTVSKPCIDWIEKRGNAAELASLNAVRDMVSEFKRTKKFGGKSPEQLKKMREDAEKRLKELDAALA